MLPDDYYLSNFRSLVDFVESTYRSLLTEDEREWLERLANCTKHSQQLYVRLLGRKADLFRLSRLSYPEIESIPVAAKELVDIGLADDNPGYDLSAILKSFTKPELIKLLELQALSGLLRADLTEKLITASNSEQQRYFKRLSESENWIQVEGHQHYTLFRLCFFGNLYQDSSEFVRTDLGTLRYENYIIDERSKPFTSREQIESHLQYFECNTLSEITDFNDSSALVALSERLPCRWPNDHHLDRRIDRLRNRIARQLERLGEFDIALNLYEQSINPPSRERCARILHKQGNQKDAGELLKKMLDDPRGEAEYQFAQQFSAKIGVSKKERKTSFKPETTTLTLSESDDRVELAASAFYSQFGDCFYVENSLIDGVLGLFIWDIVFSNVPGAFFNPFQRAPSDFYHPEFVVDREHLITERMQVLNDPLKFATLIQTSYHERYGIANPLVRWDSLSESLISKSITRIPTPHWRALFTRLLKDLRENSTGLPDLILFPDDGGYELLEIKGPGDALQKNQRRWMQYFNEHRIPCRVVNVRWKRELSSCKDKSGKSSQLESSDTISPNSCEQEPDV